MGYTQNTKSRMSKALLDGKLSQSFLSQILGFCVRNMRARCHTRLSHCRNDGAVRAMALLIIKPISTVLVMQRLSFVESRFLIIGGRHKHSSASNQHPAR